MTIRDIFEWRLRVMIVVLVVFAGLLVARLVAIQFQLDPAQTAYLHGLANQAYVRLREQRPVRGQIYDRDGELLAVNTLEYEVGVNPPLVANPAESARRLAVALEADELEIYNALTSGEPWVLLARPVGAAIGQAVQELEIYGVEVVPIAARSYPQGRLAGQLIGFVGSDNQGYYGVEGAYQLDLAGQTFVEEESAIPFEMSPHAAPRHGRDLVLTIDRDVQFLVEQELQRAIETTGSERGTIIVMDPRTGEILAMASHPSFDPNLYYEALDEETIPNPAISEQYEPGSVFKVVTMAVAIEEGAVLPSSTYNDQAELDCGGVTVANWDRISHGLIDMTQVLVQSLNVGTATIARQMGPTRFYRGLETFGIGQPTLVDLAGEGAGALSVPGDPDWNESEICTNSFGQGLAVTPLQMLTAVNAIANDGVMMQPHIVYQVIDGDDVYTTRPARLGRAISTETAHMVRDMMVQVVWHGVPDAQVPGYLVAGKTGTAQIPIPGGYEEGTSIVTFVGFLPADAPLVSVLIRLDRPDEYWGSIVAAPLFAHLAERLVILLEIPPDAVRHELAAQGGMVSEIDR